jgi:hypothetical protein
MRVSDAMRAHVGHDLVLMQIALNRLRNAHDELVEQALSSYVYNLLCFVCKNPDQIRGRMLDRYRMLNTRRGNAAPLSVQEFTDLQNLILQELGRDNQLAQATIEGHQVWGLPA